MLKYLSCAVALLSVSACSNVPPFVLNGDASVIAPAGPKISDLMANLKCELWSAVRSNERLPYYIDLPGQTEHDRKSRTAEDRYFTLKNIFQEIDYISEAEFTLDVTSSATVSPSMSFIHPYATATNLALSVSGQYGEAGHRFLNIYTSVDFERLLESPPFGGRGVSIEEEIAKNRCQDMDLAAGTELGGNLGLGESLATSLIAYGMNDVAVLPTASLLPRTGLVPAGAPPPSPSATVSQYAFGQITAQVDFAIQRT